MGRGQQPTLDKCAERVYHGSGLKDIFVAAGPPDRPTTHCNNEVPMSSHVDGDGNVMMVDVSEKDVTERTAVAEGFISMSAPALAAVREKAAAKGDVLTVAQLAGIMGSKRTSDLIPLCHPLPLSNSKIEFSLAENGIHALCRVKTQGRTGVEMEALTGVSVALLTIYDMCKSLDKSMEISAVRLLQKSGGKSGEYRRGSMYDSCGRI